MAQTIKNQTILLIGGSSGMGFSTAQLAEQYGAKVIVAGHNEEKAEKATRQLSEKAQSLYVDVVDEHSIRQMVDKIDTIDHVMVTAAPGGTGDFKEASLDIQETYIYGKFWSLFMLTKLLLPKIREDGSVTFITGGFAVQPQKGTVLVTAAFNAVEGFAKALAVELAPMRFNVIRPGLIDSGFWDYMPDNEKESFFKQEIANIPVGRKGESEDIAQAALFLMTNTFMSGHVLDVSGGAHI